MRQKGRERGDGRNREGHEESGVGSSSETISGNTNNKLTKDMNTM